MHSDKASFLDRQIRTQTFLIRDDAGNFSFAHKSFMEFFVHREMANAISDASVNIQNAVETWKHRQLSPGVLKFLDEMVGDTSLLWKLIKASAGENCHRSRLFS